MTRANAGQRLIVVVCGLGSDQAFGYQAWEVALPVIVVTRLRLKDPALLDEFFTDAVAAIEQAQKSAGNLGADALADADNAWWSVSAWQERQPMRAYVRSEPHLTITTRLDH